MRENTPKPGVRSAKMQPLGLNCESPVVLGSNLQVLQDTRNSQLIRRIQRGLNAKTGLLSSTFRRGRTARGGRCLGARRRVGAATWSRGSGGRGPRPWGFDSPRSIRVGRSVRAAQSGEPEAATVRRCVAARPRSGEWGVDWRSQGALELRAAEVSSAVAI